MYQLPYTSRSTKRRLSSYIKYKGPHLSQGRHLAKHNILEERQERQGCNRDYDSGPDDSGAFQSSPQGFSNELDHGKWQVKITKRAKYMDTGRSVGGINTHFLQR
ncbi:hypothetical protein BJY52DRAFT_1228090 [Lactarius psammicola]|nr:hypothetical protein BJY52DRAFT_1228090 [Lactarius psammicola]